MAIVVNTISDDALLAAAKQGDAGALDALVARHLPRVQRFSMKMCGEVEDANDVSQDTFMVAAESLADFRGQSSFSTWLYSIARSFCIKKRRRSKFVTREDSLDAMQHDVVGALAHPAPSPEDEAAGNELLSALQAAIDTLEPKYREVLILRDVEGLSAEEVSEVLDLNVHTVKTRLHRARMAVRVQLAPLIDGAAGSTISAPRCTRALRSFSRHLEGDLTPEQCAEMTRHLSACPKCDADCQALKQVLALCRRSPVSVAPELEQSIRRSIQALLASQG